MKKIIALTFALTFTLLAQSSVTVEESTAFDLVYDYPALLATRVYTNGVLAREFSTNEVRLVQAGAPVGMNSYAVTMPGFPRASVAFTATVFYLSGTNLVESLPSNLLDIQFRPRKPGNLRRF